MNTYIFIIPKTPQQLQDDVRKKLWQYCINNLIKQSYQNWIALLIGENALEGIEDKRFIQIEFEGRKEEKLQKATEYIIANNIKGDYVIRLDDDDFINPRILEFTSEMNFDLYVDKFQWFWHYESGKFSNRVWFWFPNTCIHKREHALSPWGNYAKGDFKRFKQQALLIENDHSKLHPYYINKTVVLAKKQMPVYIRTITSSSITAKQSRNSENYLKSFGLWRTEKKRQLNFLNQISKKSKVNVPSYTLKEKIQITFHNILWSKRYMKMVLYK